MGRGPRAVTRGRRDGAAHPVRPKLRKDARRSSISTATRPTQAPRHSQPSATHPSQAIKKAGTQVPASLDLQPAPSTSVGQAWCDRYLQRLQVIGSVLAAATILDD